MRRTRLPLPPSATPAVCHSRRLPLPFATPATVRGFSRDVRLIFESNFLDVSAASWTSTAELFTSANSEYKSIGLMLDPNLASLSNPNPAAWNQTPRQKSV